VIKQRRQSPTADRGVVISRAIKRGTLRQTYERLSAVANRVLWRCRNKLFRWFRSSLRSSATSRAVRGATGGA